MLRAGHHGEHNVPAAPDQKCISGHLPGLPVQPNFDGKNTTAAAAAVSKISKIQTDPSIEYLLFMNG
jgi:hypothetical protein